MSFLAVPAVLVSLLVAYAFGRHRDATRRRAFLRRAALVLTIVAGALATLFTAGETFADPGGIAAVGLLALWLGPLAVVSVVVWRSPVRGVPIAYVLTAAVVALNAWYAVAPETWRAFEDRRGPVRAIVTFAVAVVVGLLGRARPVLAGWLLLVVGIVPAFLVSPGNDPVAGTAQSAAGAPAVATGCLYLLSAWPGPRRREATRRHAPPRSRVA